MPTTPKKASRSIFISAEAKDRLTRCLTYSRLAAHEPVSPDLDTIAGGAGSAANAAGSAEAPTTLYTGVDYDNAPVRQINPPRFDTARSVCVGYPTSAVTGTAHLYVETVERFLSGRVIWRQVPTPGLA
jgi:hypothetical protein